MFGQNAFMFYIIVMYPRAFPFRTHNQDNADNFLEYPPPVNTVSYINSVLISILLAAANVLA